MNLGSARIPLNLMRCLPHFLALLVQKYLFTGTKVLNTLETRCRHASCESWVPISNGTHSAGDDALLAGTKISNFMY